MVEITIIWGSLRLHKLSYSKVSTKERKKNSLHLLKVASLRKFHSISKVSLKKNIQKPFINKISVFGYFLKSNCKPHIPHSFQKNFRHWYCSMSKMIYTFPTLHQKSKYQILFTNGIFQTDCQLSLRQLKTASSTTFQRIPGFSVTQCQK